jgi:hypothetical protein
VSLLIWQVVAAILKSGLRIMPHSGGRVGSGIYLASENGKSSGYDCDRCGTDEADETEESAIDEGLIAI